MYEPCEETKCNVDQRSFKAYFTRWLAATAELVPLTHDRIIKNIETSAAAAVKSCTAGDRGTSCGLRWTIGSNDGSIGVGEQMAVLEIIQSNLVDKARGWASAVKGTGTSKGDVEAGTGSSKTADDLTSTPITAGDRVGAGILTALMLIGVVGGSATMMISE
jgi:mannan endo-1,6-alpha-mannosidase